MLVTFANNILNIFSFNLKLPFQVKFKTMGPAGSGGAPPAKAATVLGTAGQLFQQVT